MNQSPEYLALHEWLFKAFEMGLNCELGQMHHSFFMCWFLGPDWRKERELFKEADAQERFLLSQLEAKMAKEFSLEEAHEPS